jgi:hypothetical protein
MGRQSEQPLQSAADDDTQANPATTLSEAFLSDLLADWQAHGTVAIASVRAERPHDYLKLVTGTFPKDTGAKGNELDELSDEQLAGQLGAVLARLAAAGADAGARARAAKAKKPARGVPPLSEAE